MWQLLVLSWALAHNHGPEWRAGWERAKARAELYDRYHHGRISGKELRRGLAEHLSPQEEAWFRQHGQDTLRRLEADISKREDFLRKAREEYQRRFVGPPPPPDVK
jgi:hypothetical protein